MKSLLEKHTNPKNFKQLFLSSLSFLIQYSGNYEKNSSISNCLSKINSMIRKIFLQNITSNKSIVTPMQITMLIIQNMNIHYVKQTYNSSYQNVIVNALSLLYYMFVKCTLRR